MTDADSAPKAAPRVQPPKRLSTLIQLAVADARSLPAGVYEPDCDAWHDPPGLPDADTPRCYICVAGAVMARSLNVDADTQSSPEQQGEWCDALHALDHAREGFWQSAVSLLNNDVKPVGPAGLTPEQHRVLKRLRRPACADFDNHSTFSRHLASLARAGDRLEAAGL